MIKEYNKLKEAIDNLQKLKTLTTSLGMDETGREENDPNNRPRVSKRYRNSPC